MLENKDIKWGYALVIPLVLFGLYMVLDFFVSLLFASFNLDTQIASFCVYGAIIVFIGLWMYRMRDDFTVNEKYSMSAAGVLFLIVVFILIYISSQAFGNWIRLVAPYGLTDSYSSLADTNLILYVILSVTLAPIAEEFLYRWMLYRHFRFRMKFIPSFVISTAVFTFIHGTLMHIPVTVALSLFIVVIYEVTKRFYWCVVIHAAYNFCSMFFVFALDKLPLGFMILWACLMAILFIMYYFRKTIFYKWFLPGTFDRMEKQLDDRRRNLGFNVEEEDEDEDINSNYF